MHIGGADGFLSNNAEVVAMKRTIVFSVVFLSFIVGGCQSSPPSLHRAAQQGNAAGVKSLLDEGADVNVADARGNTPLMEAVMSGTQQTVRLLLERGADVNVTDNWGNAPLMEAVKKSSNETIRLLLERGADVNAANSEGWTSLMWAARIGSWETVNLLLDSGATVKARNVNGSTILMEATKQGSNWIVRLLLERGADVNAADSEGWTSLMRAAGKDRKIQRWSQVGDLGKMFFQGAPVEGVIAGAVVVGEDRGAAWTHEVRRSGSQSRPLDLELELAAVLGRGEYRRVADNQV